MAQQSIFGRISQMTRANIHALIDNAEDPQKMLDQMIRDYTASIGEAEQAVAQTIGNLRMMEADQAEDASAAADWGNKAIAASTRADQLRSSGNTAEADRLDNLAKVAIERQIKAEQDASSLSGQITSQREVADKLRSGLENMKGKLQELKSRRDQLVSRQKVAVAQNQMHDAIKSIDLADPTSELTRFEEKIRREEARAMGNAELAASSLDNQFAELEDAGTAIEVESRLAALKSSQPPSDA
jgi:phage shock protein A